VQKNFQVGFGTSFGTLYNDETFTTSITEKSTMFTAEQRQQLVISHLGFADQIACKQHRKLPASVYLEDVKSAAYCGLVDAVSRYRGNIPFKIFASYRINGEIKDYLRSLGWGTRNTRWQGQSWDETYDYASESEPVINDSFEMLIAGLSKSAKKVVWLYYVEDLTMKEIGKKIRLSQTRVFQIIKESLAKLNDSWIGQEHELWQAIAG
jgi:RNA polymerase sigma factor (sigma-70 family)